MCAVHPDLCVVSISKTKLNQPPIANVAATGFCCCCCWSFRIIRGQSTTTSRALIIIILFYTHRSLINFFAIDSTNYTIQTVVGWLRRPELVALPDLIWSESNGHSISFTLHSSDYNFDFGLVTGLFGALLSPFFCTMYNNHWLTCWGRLAVHCNNGPGVGRREYSHHVNWTEQQHNMFTNYGKECGYKSTAWEKLYVPVVNSSKVTAEPNPPFTSPVEENNRSVI